MRDTLERLFWTFVSAALGALAVGPLIGISAWQGAALTGAAAVVNLLSILARQHLDSLPAPGKGLPGLPVKGDAGQSTIDLLIKIMCVVILFVFVWWFVAQVIVTTVPR